MTIPGFYPPADIAQNDARISTNNELFERLGPTVLYAKQCHVMFWIQ